METKMGKATRLGKSDGGIAVLLKRDDVRGDFIKRAELTDSDWRAYESAWSAEYRRCKDLYQITDYSALARKAVAK
jgi:hypothetical protein